ncbi:hypothetical protein [uncultured Sphaerochaeta sp.]|uniref:hypothetical protein n=1 Tax=uncultured Sphaerochaeta sp. TaxID=886478 RepID=UPI002A0A6F5B|nr:hypothetical protein [uncultured Sphaerochaeta sp.]
MKEKELHFVFGVDLDENTYTLCRLDLSGKNPRYYSGRADTSHGQVKFLSRLSAFSLVLIPDGLLAIRAYEKYGDAILIFPKHLFWDTWETAGVKKGKTMARFAALFLLKEQLPAMQLTQKQIRQILLDQESDLERIQRVGDTAQMILQEGFTQGKATNFFDKALQNEQDSEEKKLELPTPSSEGDSFLAQFQKILDDIH